MLDPRVERVLLALRNKSLWLLLAGLLGAFGVIDYTEGQIDAILAQFDVIAGAILIVVAALGAIFGIHNQKAVFKADIARAERARAEAARAEAARVQD